MQVRLFREPGRVVVAQRFTAADGSYAFANPGSGTYRVRFLDPGATYLTEFWDDKPYYSQAGDLVLAPGTHLTANAEMRAPTSISGTVTDEKTSLPLAGLEVRLYREPGRVVVANATTAADGSYTFANPGAGTYRLRFSDPVGGTYVTEFWDDARTYVAASDVVVGAGASATADAALAIPELSMMVNVAADGSDAVDDGICEVTPGLGDCSIRAAIDEANVHPGHDQITIAPGVNPTLTMGGLVVASDLAIVGNGATIHNTQSQTVIEQEEWDHGADTSSSSRTLSMADVVITGSGAGVVARVGLVEPDGFRPGHVSLDGVTIATSGTAFQSTGATFDITDSTLDASDAGGPDEVAVDLWAGSVGTIDSSTLIARAPTICR
ncbi:MAG: carboxypeptidase-like regulatory domain-containing protein [Acidimicrobiales bacterium]